MYTFANNIMLSIIERKMQQNILRGPSFETPSVHRSQALYNDSIHEGMHAKTTNQIHRLI
jgi:hypothetical protein